MPPTARLLSSIALAALCASAVAQTSGYLCCNMRSDGSWISDSNYVEDSKHLIPAGTPLKFLGLGRNRVNVEIEGKKQSIGNDYSRGLTLEAFQARYVVADDPAAKIASYPKKIQEAIKAAKLTKGMTREQAIMAVGYPIQSENSDLNAPSWRMWLWSFSEFKVNFDGAGRVANVETDEDTRSKIVMP